MDFRILGPVEAYSASGVKLPLGGAAPRAILAVLLLHRTPVVSPYELARTLCGEEALYGDRRATHIHTAQKTLSRLRTALGDQHLVSKEYAGYRLRRENDDLDADRFARLLHEGTAALRKRDAHGAAMTLRDAIREWSGNREALQGLDLDPDPFRERKSSLEAQLVEAHELRIAADLAIGPAPELAAELEARIAEDGTREVLWRSLMMWHYSTSGAAEALDIYRRAVGAYRSADGDPPNRLRELATRIQRGDRLPDQGISQPPLPSGQARAPRSVTLLEPAVIEVGQNVRSPARLIQARSGVIPYTARLGLLTALRSWVKTRDAFAMCLIGGRGGSGKTHLGVELCKEAHRLGWLNGFLPDPVDQGTIDALGDQACGRLVVVDYAERRVEQLDRMLQQLTSTAAPQCPARVVLLVRAAPRFGDSWATVLRRRTGGRQLDAALDGVAQRILDDMGLDACERQHLVTATMRSLADRMGATDAMVTGARDTPIDVSDDLFASPLMVVIATVNAMQGTAGAFDTPRELLEELLFHEQRYWTTSRDRFGLRADEEVLRRVVALATITGATSEAEAVDLLRLVPDLEDAPAATRGELARWMHGLYPGDSTWWNPLEPDLLGEYLIATTATTPAVLAGAVQRDPPPAALGRILDVCARLAPDQPDVRAKLAPILSEALPRLCRLAAVEARDIRSSQLRGNTLIAEALNGAVTKIAIDPSVIPEALLYLPADHRYLGPLGRTLEEQYGDQLGDY